MAKVLSIKYPWCAYVVFGSKDVENRTWKYPPKYRGRLYIHCGKKQDSTARLPFRVDRAKEQGLIQQNFWPRYFDDIAGTVIGYVDLDDIRRDDIDSPWYTGDLGLILSNPQPLLRPVPWRGQLGFFNVPDAVLKAAQEAR